MQPIGTQAFEMWKAWYETNQDLLIGAIQQIRMILAEILQYTSSLAKDNLVMKEFCWSCEYGGCQSTCATFCRRVDAFVTMVSRMIKAKEKVKD
ncbi:hypothetical protein P8452_63636 [Trifolium repens]|nr:hypothetical protein P8452_63636 [Trifolium repens]